MTEFNFENVEAAVPSEGGSYLKPGMYNMKLHSVEYIVSSQKQTPGMELEFICQSANLDYNDAIAKCKFYITSNTLSRLQYLHEGLFNVKMTKKFQNAEEIVTYFKSLIPKSTFKPMVAGGTISSKGKLYSDMPYLGFFVKNEMDFEEGEFEENGELFQSVITSEQKTLNTSNENSGDVFDDDSPF